MTAWNYGDILDAVETIVPPERSALIHGEHVVTWRDFSRRTNNLARAMLANGARPGDKIAFYMRNCAQYSEAIAAAFKARLTHVNVNYRYVDLELIYLLDNSDATVVIYAAEFAPRVAAIRAQLPHVTQWIEVGGGRPDTKGRPPAAATPLITRRLRQRATANGSVSIAPATTCCSSIPAARPACRRA